jgi:2-octaprenyl-6-methoxyphenol hydroxylase
MTEKATDIIIAGGGYVGLSVAVSIAASDPSLGVAVIDAAPEDAIGSDRRASAVAAAATRMLERIGVWSGIADKAQPIREMIVTDSRLNDVARPVFLTFAEAAADNSGNPVPFAHMVDNRVLVGALRERARQLGVALAFAERVDRYTVHPGHIEIGLASGDRREARLLVAADGVRSHLRELSGIRTLRWPYDQMGIVATVAHERDHEGRAEEHFLPAGPFAILPLTGKRSSLVWTERTADARRLLKADRLLFELELERRFGHHLGELKLEDEPRAYPLGLTLARDFVRERLALAGDAAHGIHPIAGQGLNLGFKDAAALAETVVEASRLGLDIGQMSVLERYERWRRFDTVRMGVVTDVLNRLFSNDVAPVRALRDTGLAIVDRLPGLKRMFIDQAAGGDRSAPRLLLGEAI